MPELPVYGDGDRPHRDTEEVAHVHPAHRPSLGQGVRRRRRRLLGFAAPTTSDSHANPGGRRRRWSRRLATGLLVLGLGVSAGTASAYTVTRLEGDTTTSSPASVSSATISSLVSVAEAVKPSVVTVIVRSAGQEAEGSGIMDQCKA